VTKVTACAARPRGLRAWAARNGYELDQTLTLKIAAAGRFGARTMREGIVPRGSVLAIEALDRLSRQSIRKAQRALEDLIDLGVSIVTLNDGRMYDDATIERDPFSLVIALAHGRPSP
jgi:DNA invertase Pin-like site-specific DNA recombinase